VTAEVALAPTPALAAPSRVPFWRRLVRSRSGLIGLVLTGIVVVAALAALFHLTPFDPVSQRPVDRLQGPSATYLLGTDQFGRDILSRVAAGAATSLVVALVAVTVAAVVGTAAGVAAGYFGPPVSPPVLGVANVLFAFPPLLLALALASALTRNWFTVALAIAIVYVPIFIRVSRGPVLALRDADFIKASRVLGYSTRRILFRHVLPNISAIVIVQFSLAMSWAVLTEASLSFVGLGTPPPAPALGSMVLDAKSLVASYWWTMAAPGAMIVIFVVGLNLLGDGLRDALDPRFGVSR
jgi:peptide/nickel transport system permease protein